MKREYAKLFSFILGITFILSGVIFAVTRSYKDDKQAKIDEENKIIDEIIDVYEAFKGKIEEFSNRRDTLYEEYAEFTTYYTTMPDGYDAIIEKIKNYEILVSEVEDAAAYLKDNCENPTYSSIDANTKCNSYVINLEKTINVFVLDVEYFNSKLKEYNEWIIEENKSLKENEKYNELALYETFKYKDYIDVDNDGVYLGKESD